MADERSRRATPLAPESFEGLWWPAGVDARTPGRLECGPERIALHVNGSFEGGPLKLTDHPVVYGVAGSRAMTLRDCMGIGQSVSFGWGMAAETYLVNSVWLDAHVGTFNARSVALELEHLMEWSGARGPRAEPTDARARASVAWQIQRPDVVAKCTDAVVRIVTTQPYTLELDSVTLRTEVHVEVEPSVVQPMDDLERRYVRPLQNLLTLAAARPVAILRLSADVPESDEVSGRRGPHLATIRRSWLVRPSSDDIQLHQGEFTFSLAALGDPSSAFDRWLRLHEELAPACDHFFGNYGAPPRFITTEFLNHCQAVEAYCAHRFNTLSIPKTDHEARVSRVLDNVENEEDRQWVRRELEEANRRSFMALVTEFAAQAPPVTGPVIGDPSQFARTVRDIRNDLAHGRAHPDTHLTFVANQRLRVLLHAWFMRELGLPDEVIAKHLEPSRLMRELRQAVGVEGA